MFTLQGKHNTAVVYAASLDQETTSQIIELCNQEFVTGSKIRIMPDAHAGAGCVIGTTMTITDKVVPNLVGVDIGCGMEVVELEERSVDFARLDRYCHKNPSGRNIRTIEHDYLEHVNLDDLRCYSQLNIARAELSLGTLGGNHFIELDSDENGNFYLVIHSARQTILVISFADSNKVITNI